MLKDAFLLIVIQIHVQFLILLGLLKAENAEAMPILLSLIDSNVLGMTNKYFFDFHETAVIHGHSKK